MEAKCVDISSVNLYSISYVFKIHRFRNILDGKMNTVTFVVVFLCGLFSAVSLVFLSDYLRFGDSEPSFSATKYRSTDLNIIPSFALLPNNIEIEEQSLTVIFPNQNQETATSTSDKDCSENSSRNEAIRSSAAALEMKKSGKYEKAKKLFEHALALCPRQSDVLTSYGEFLEEFHEDLINADHMYVRALAYTPEHSRALQNRERTSPLVMELDASQLKRIEDKRNKLIRIPDSSGALRRVKKEEYFRHIYHTVAIEGNTMSLAQTRHIVETRMSVQGKSVIEHNEILGLDDALRYINQTLINRIGQITLDEILEIHRLVLVRCDPFEAGRFRRTQVFVGEHTPPAPSELHYLMESFIEWMNSNEALLMHPIKYAALAHYKLVHIHPFNDGNGRTSRLLMNLILMQAGYPPVVIRKEDRHEYYEYLTAANEGDTRPFIRFIADSTERTVDTYLWMTAEYSSRVPALEQQNKSENLILIENNP